MTKPPPSDEHGPLWTMRHFDLARTEPNRLTTDELEELAEALAAAKRRLAARESIGIGNGNSPAFPKPKPPPPPPEAA